MWLRGPNGQWVAQNHRTFRWGKASNLSKMAWLVKNMMWSQGRELQVGASPWSKTTSDQPNDSYRPFDESEESKLGSNKQMLEPMMLV